MLEATRANPDIRDAEGGEALDGVDIEAVNGRPQ
jgi:hypothetical protein